MDTADYYYPDWGCLVDIFCYPRLKNCHHGLLGIEPTTLRSLFSVRCLRPLSHGNPVSLNLLDQEWSCIMFLIFSEECEEGVTIIKKPLHYFTKNADLSISEKMLQRKPCLKGHIHCRLPRVVATIEFRLVTHQTTLTPYICNTSYQKSVVS